MLPVISLAFPPKHINIIYADFSNLTHHSNSDVNKDLGSVMLILVLVLASLVLVLVLVLVGLVLVIVLAC